VSARGNKSADAVRVAEAQLAEATARRDRTSQALEAKRAEAAQLRRRCDEVAAEIPDLDAKSARGDAAAREASLVRRRELRESADARDQCEGEVRVLERDHVVAASELRRAEAALADAIAEPDWAEATKVYGEVLRLQNEEIPRLRTKVIACGQRIEARRGRPLSPEEFELMIMARLGLPPQPWAPPWAMPPAAPPPSLSVTSAPPPPRKLHTVEEVRALAIELIEQGGASLGEIARHASDYLGARAPFQIPDVERALGLPASPSPSYIPVRESLDTEEADALARGVRKAIAARDFAEAARARDDQVRFDAIGLDRNNGSAG
jgi:hypothetical protein